ncbi:uncharacterized protein STEHIDRAFT_163398 [Stereum hirsutum FP-91666 SS1]|uniref:Uncharacterized protein n=1 Tax=Stereum hirsutum (strain FP-91666) TaxID=721885 RepID=R7RWT6_STEHR|nr:uncharacterized protein STEHIDRAFT_163398 [Stereum hirsutum FP-91666 SS1]EIM79841.1 hypothetical protein STEHIDRAFT_163398 [Stereum hirsutum FP-91666 SS1]
MHDHNHTEQAQRALTQYPSQTQSQPTPQAVLSPSQSKPAAKVSTYTSSLLQIPSDPNIHAIDFYASITPPPLPAAHSHPLPPRAPRAIPLQDRNCTSISSTATPLPLPHSQIPTTPLPCSSQLADISAASLPSYSLILPSSPNVVQTASSLPLVQDSSSGNGVGTGNGNVGGGEGEEEQDDIPPPAYTLVADESAGESTVPVDVDDGGESNGSQVPVESNLPSSPTIYHQPSSPQSSQPSTSSHDIPVLEIHTNALTLQSVGAFRATITYFDPFALDFYASAGINSATDGFQPVSESSTNAATSITSPGSTSNVNAATSSAQRPPVPPRPPSSYSTYNHAPPVVRILGMARRHALTSLERILLPASTTIPPYSTSTSGQFVLYVLAIEPFTDPSYTSILSVASCTSSINDTPIWATHRPTAFLIAFIWAPFLATASTSATTTSIAASAITISSIPSATSATSIGLRPSTSASSRSSTSTST